MAIGSTVAGRQSKERMHLGGGNPITRGIGETLVRVDWANVELDVREDWA